MASHSRGRTCTYSPACELAFYTVVQSRPARCAVVERALSSPARASRKSTSLAPSSTADSPACPLAAAAPHYPEQPPMSSEDEFGDDLAWDDATLEELASLDTRTPAQQRAKPAPAPPPPRASQIPPQRRAQPPPNPPPQHRRAPLLSPHPPPPGPSQLAPGGTQGGAALPGGTQQQQYLGPAPKTGILRPPKPPQRSTQAAAASPAPPPRPAAPAPALAAAPAPAPAPKRHPRQSLNAAGEPGFVDPNPFAGRPPAAPPAPVAVPAAARARARTPAAVKSEPDAAHGLDQAHGRGQTAVRRDEGDEDLPAIAFDEHGGGGYKAEPQRGTTVFAPGARGGARGGPSAHAAVVAQRGGAPISPAPAVAMQDGERQELERLRAEKDQVRRELPPSVPAHARERC